MISRVWHGWTTHENAEAYETLLREEIFRDIENRAIKGYLGINLFRRDMNPETEFMTVMWFDSFDAVREFAGKDHEKAVVPPKAKELLSRYDKRSQHYEVIIERRGEQIT
ncbi:MAG: antibiotic biosynthesis monooxygenase [Candidatus Heimdallarchaeota archaeon]